MLQGQSESLVIASRFIPTYVRSLTIASVGSSLASDLFFLASRADQTFSLKDSVLSLTDRKRFFFLIHTIIRPSVWQPLMILFIIRVFSD